MQAGEATDANTATLRLKPGSKLIRTWRGQTHTVQVLENGFEHQGQHYASLSKVAESITGAHWSGPRFFGLRDRTGSRDQGRAG